MSAPLPALLEPAVRDGRPGGKDALIVFACCFAASHLIGGVSGLATAAWIIATKQPISFDNLWMLFSSPFLTIGALADGAVCIVIVWFFGCRPFGRSLAEGVDLRARPLGWTIAAPFAGMALALPALLLPQNEGAPIYKALAQPGGLLVIGIAALLLPISEEIYYRGFMQPVLRRALGRVATVAIITVWFGAIHAPQLFGAWSDLAYVTFVGFLWTVVREISGSTLPSLLMHWCYNATLVALTAVGMAMQGG